MLSVDEQQMIRAGFEQAFLDGTVFPSIFISMMIPIRCMPRSLQESHAEC